MPPVCNAAAVATLNLNLTLQATREEIYGLVQQPLSACLLTGHLELLGTGEREQVQVLGEWARCLAFSIKSVTATTSLLSLP